MTASLLPFAETLATWDAAFCVDPAKHPCVGLEINAIAMLESVVLRRRGRIRQIDGE